MRVGRYSAAAVDRAPVQRPQRRASHAGDGPADARVPPRVAVIARLQRTHGNAHLARWLAAVDRAPKDDQVQGGKPPGYRAEGPIPDFAKPRPCGTKVSSGDSRDPEFIVHHVQSSAHWLAHDQEFTGGETCPEGCSVRVQDVIAGKRRLAWGQAEFEDLWTDHGTQVGSIIDIIKTKDGRTEYSVAWFDPAICRAETKVVTGGFLYRR